MSDTLDMHEESGYTYIRGRIEECWLGGEPKVRAALWVSYRAIRM